MAYFPTQRKLAGIAILSEERNKWIKGRLVSDNSIYFEVSFEAATPKFPETNICYFGFWRAGRTARERIVAEFQLGKLFVTPTEDDWVAHVRPFMMAMRGYMPITLA